ncbi:carboxypeptidase-like regulatory domain-containing protein [Edaphobacter aggregans]|uniref:carboxypeptidase-like regulatory domain-containing protein n=1 Tax=Edaphobacter aggregans TaxID=570835 RepID=UPI000555F178|nr:carboxypeptidase-like regulatory domain-containing protein [Edaphobacter aggregans]
MMRVLSSGLALLLAASYCLAMPPGPAPAPPTPYRITGVVVSRVDGTPIPHSHLTPSLTQQRGRGPGRQFPAVPAVEGFDADEHGRFSIPLPSAGAWQLNAAAPGYVSQAYDEHQNYSSAIVLTAAAPTIDLRFQLSPEASITGAVLDEAGEPVRNARVGLLMEQLSIPERKADSFRPQTFAQTDDRGVYEFANLAPGHYRVLVEAKPWYASTAQSRRFNSQTSSALSAPPADPSLDVTYQLSWYPGVNNAAEAETIDLHGGDVRRADFHLVPIPAVHLRILPPPPAEQSGGRVVPAFPVLERMDTGIAGLGFAQVAITNGPQGQVDVGGLAPGPYRVRLAQQNAETRTALVEISDGSARVVDFNAAASSLANITVNFDNEGTEERPFGLELIDAETGQQFFPFGGNHPMPVVMRRGPQTQQPRESGFEIPPGRYEANFTGRGDAYLTGISAQGAEVAGRFVTFQGGDATLTLHMASGHATVTGIATFDGKPAVGAMVLLVPAGLDDPGSFTTVVRDQTNTDGSFDLPKIVPGQYILIAIDHGWSVNWSDPATLRGYLTQGVPLEPRSGANLRQDITAQAP